MLLHFIIFVMFCQIHVGMPRFGHKRSWTHSTKTILNLDPAPQTRIKEGIGKYISNINSLEIRVHSETIRFNADETTRPLNYSMQINPPANGNCPIVPCPLRLLVVGKMNVLCHESANATNNISFCCVNLINVTISMLDSAMADCVPPGQATASLSRPQA